MSQLLLGQAKLFIVDEEERPVFTVEEFGDRNWTTDSRAVLVEQDSVLRSFTEVSRGQSFIVEVIVGGEIWLTMVPVDTAAKVVCAAPRYKLDLYGAIARTFSARAQQWKLSLQQPHRYAVAQK